MIYTLSMIKPDATKRGVEDAMFKMIEDAGFEVLARRRLALTRPQAEHFYDIHREKGFFNEMIDEMISGDIVAQLLRKNDAVAQHRDLIGATDPLQAAENTVRKKFGLSIGQNSIHGSDSDENAEKEIAFFFGLMDKIKL